MQPNHPSHKTRYSDSSHYDEICIYCRATDNLYGSEASKTALSRPCPSKPKDNK